MIAARFRLVGWVAGCAGAALLCYMASQSVAAERSALGRVDAEIADTQSDIDRLTTEITARSRAGQVERWNNVLALQAARPVQYVTSGVQLASLAGGRPLPLDPAIALPDTSVRTVAYQPAPQPAMPPAAAAPAPAPAPVQAQLRQATFVRPKPDRLADAQPVLIKASYEKPAPPALPAPMPPKAQAKPETRKSAKADPVKPPVEAKPKPKLVIAKAETKKPGGLLPDDLGALIAAERKTKSSKSAS